jgi:hypothetical protein
MKFFTYVICAVLTTFVIPVPAIAALGEDVASVQADQAHMKAASRKIGAVGSYSVHEMLSPAGAAVREYVSSTGKVFAVTWKGPYQPDIRQLLGKYFTDYSQGAKASHAHHRHLSIQQPGLVIQSSGHMRAFAGRAYIPQLLPEGMAIEEIQ